MSRRCSARLPLLPLLLLPALLAACGGGGDDTGADAAAGAALPCNTALFVAGAVAQPTSTQLAAYAGTYDGNEGNYGPNPGDPFVKSGTAVLVVKANGAVSYKGTDHTPVSVCIDKAAGPYGTLLYVHTDKAHLDIADKADATLGQAWGISLADATLLFQGAVKR